MPKSMRCVRGGLHLARCSQSTNDARCECNLTVRVTQFAARVRRQPWALASDWRRCVARPKALLGLGLDGAALPVVS